MDISDDVVGMVAREVVGDPDAAMIDWSVEALGGGAASEIGSSAIRRVRGTVATAAGPTGWSVIRKALRSGDVEFGGLRPDRDDPRGWEYWRREADACASGLLDDLGDGLVAPRCYRIDETAAGGIALRLQDVTNVPGDDN